MKFFKKSDRIVILVIVMIALAISIGYKLTLSKKTAKAEIYYYSNLVMTIDLSTKVDKIFSIPQNDHVVFHLYKDGTIRFEESDCPDQVCVKAGKIGSVGQAAACLPNGIVIKIVPVGDYSNDDVDITVGRGNDPNGQKDNEQKDNEQKDNG